jgi:hypothetical protein
MSQVPLRQTVMNNTELHHCFTALSYEIVALIEAGKIEEAAQATNSFISISKKLREQNSK